MHPRLQRTNPHGPTSTHRPGLGCSVSRLLARRPTRTAKIGVTGGAPGLDGACVREYAPPRSDRSGEPRVQRDQSLALRNHLGVRDVLRLDTALRDESATVKRRAVRTAADIDDYLEQKNDVLDRFLRTAGLADEERASITASTRGITGRGAHGCPRGTLPSGRVRRARPGRDEQAAGQLEGQRQPDAGSHDEPEDRERHGRTTPASGEPRRDQQQDRPHHVADHEPGHSHRDAPVCPRPVRGRTARGFLGGQVQPGPGPTLADHAERDCHPVQRRPARRRPPRPSSGRDSPRRHHAVMVSAGAAAAEVRPSRRAPGTAPPAAH
ncbi:GrpB family protein [Curtobacterium sp. VKM Ac-2887]|nr:GrpB family protein [Curtobacterium sp. VKM Ac-2887]